MIQAAGGCLQVQAGSRSDGALIELQPCVSFGDPLYDAQQWASVRPDASASDGSFQLRNQRSGKCIDLTGASAVNGAAMQQWTCLGPQQQNQVWVPNWPPAPPDYDTIDLPVARPRQTAQGAPLF